MDPPVKVVDPPPSTARGRRWVVPAAAAALVLLGAGLALAISLPLSLRGRGGARGFEPLSASGAGEPDGVERTFYIAADVVDWDYAPAGKNLCKGTPFGEKEAPYVSQGAGKRFRKALFREYADASFDSPKPRGEREKHLGVLGPPLRAEVGDTLVVVLRNNAPFPVSLEPGGLAAAPAVAANPGETITYRWRVPAAAGPADDGPSSRFWMYRSTADIVGDTQAGLAGPIVVARRGALEADGSRPSDVDREMFLILQARAMCCWCCCCCVGSALHLHLQLELG